jgi:CDP-glucose 4,6-dehydratase
VTDASDWAERPVLVTGATGLLGGWLTEALQERRARVVCLVRDWVPSSRFYAEGINTRVETVPGDVADQETIERVLGEYEIRTVFHLAAQTIVPVANRNPVSTFESNVKGTWSTLEACRRSPLVSEVLVASSDKAYGSQKQLPYRESTPLEGRSPYDVSKSCADLIAQSYAHSFGLPVCVARCGNFFGGGDLNWSRLVPGTMRDLLAGRSPVIRSDGSLVRDYVYVEDGASAYIHLAEALMARRDLVGRAFNFSLQQPLTVLEMLSHICAAVGTDIAPTVLGHASNEIHSQHLDSTAARDELAWRPVTGLEEGLRRTAAWYRQHLSGPASHR